MQRRRGIFVALIGGLLLAVMVTPALAQDRQDIDEFGSGEVRDFEGDLELFCPDYPVGDCLLILAEVSGPACTDPTPLVKYDVKLGPGVEADAVDITFINPEGEDATFPEQPLTGELLWPGARSDEGDLDWPGWVLGEDGWFLADPDALEFPLDRVQITFDAGPSKTVAAPQLEAEACAPEEAEVEGIVLTRDPPEEAAALGTAETRVLGVTLPRTGASTLLLVALGALLTIAGGVLLRSRRRAADGA